MEDKVEIWPPNSANQQHQIDLAKPTKRLNIAALFLGASVGLTYWAGVWCASYSYARSVGFGWQMELPLGLAAPQSSEFLTGLGVGSLLLLALLVVLRRPMGDFGRGVAATYLPFGLTFLLLLLDYHIEGRGPAFVH